EHGGALGDPHGVIHLRYADDGAVSDADPPCLDGAGRQEDLGRRAMRVFLEEVMFDGPHGVEPERVGEAHLLEGVLVYGALDAVGERAWDGQLEEEAELHAGWRTLARPDRRRQGSRAPTSPARREGHLVVRDSLGVPPTHVARRRPLLVLSLTIFL